MNTERIDAAYNKLKAEADSLYGVKESYTPEEFFGKLRYVVNGYYDEIQSKITSNNRF